MIFSIVKLKNNLYAGESSKVKLTFAEKAIKMGVTWLV